MTGSDWSTWTVQTIDQLKVTVAKEQLIAELAKRMPIGSLVTVSVDGTPVPVRTYEGEAITHFEPAEHDPRPFSFEGELVQTYMELHIVDKPTDLDRVDIVVQNRRVPLAKLRESLPGLPEILFSRYPRVAGYIQADWLAPLTQMSRSDFTNLNDPRFSHLVDFVRAGAKKLNETFERISRSVEDEVDQKIGQEAVSRLSESIQGNPLVDNFFQVEERVVCLKCERPIHPMHKCRAREWREVICWPCCIASWQQNPAEAYIPGCTTACKFHGSEPKERVVGPTEPKPGEKDSDMFTDPRKKKPLYIQVGPQRLWVRFMPMPHTDREAELDLPARTIYLNTAHIIYKVRRLEGVDHAINWAFALIGIQIGVFLNQPAGPGWSTALDFMTSEAEKAYRKLEASGKAHPVRLASAAS
jgi:hypothetical protein